MVNIAFILFFNIYQLKIKDLFRGAYVKLMIEPEFLNNYSPAPRSGAGEILYI